MMALWKIKLQNRTSLTLTGQLLVKSVKKVYHSLTFVRAAVFTEVIIEAANNTIPQT